MKVSIYLKENNSFMGDFTARNNCKQTTIVDMAKKYIEKYYNCSIRRTLATGKIEFATGKSDISYIMFGENLPFNNFYLVKEV